MKPLVVCFVLLAGFGQTALTQSFSATSIFIPHNVETISQSDSSSSVAHDTILLEDVPKNVWGLDILISNDGFGLGTFYRREFDQTLFGFANFSISESKDEREVDRYDPFTQTTFTPGKLNRFLVIPLMFGVQKRLFSEEITETFRPYINAGAGPTMIFAAPFVEITQKGTSTPDIRQVEFFNSLGKGQAHYTVGGFIGFGANFGSDRSSLLGVNFRYYFTYLFNDGLPSTYSTLPQGGTPFQVTSNKKDFGGFFITLNIGMAY